MSQVGDSGSWGGIFAVRAAQDVLRLRVSRRVALVLAGSSEQADVTAMFHLRVLLALPAHLVLGRDGRERAPATAAAHGIHEWARIGRAG